ncbi:hypothetical protein T484DRAFT_1845795 [Baffinella frigidus]|nr:hypothetical protein T484DRAFT_1845795 [Cryptophyta sp. CCMP2293]
MDSATDRPALLHAWGSNQYGQLGRLGDDCVTPSPCDSAQRIPASIVQLALGGGHSIARASDGSVW